MSGTTRQHRLGTGATGRTHEQEGGKMKKLLVAGLAILASLGVAQTVLAGIVTTNFVTTPESVKIHQ